MTGRTLSHESDYDFGVFASEMDFEKFKDAITWPFMILQRTFLD